MNLYNQRAATLGKPKYTMEQMAEIVQRKNDDVADNMFCICNGADKLLVSPVPFFRESSVESWEKIESNMKAVHARMEEILLAKVEANEYPFTFGQPQSVIAVFIVSFGFFLLPVSYTHLTLPTKA